MDSRKILVPSTDDSMKCQKCEKPATFHITELTGPKPIEHHLCEDHAREYLGDSSEQEGGPGSLASTLAEGMTKQMSLSKTADDLKKLDQQSCPICGITFYDFRSRGRLGCPNDYDCFAKQIAPLILSIHGETEHVGKGPKRAGGQTNQRPLLIKLRRELDEAIRQENYEQASMLRDKLKEVESE